MRLAVAILLAAALGAACSARSLDPCEPCASPSREPWRDVPQISSRKGLGHICPFTPHLAYTARHVVVEQQHHRAWFIPLIWKQDPSAGTLMPLYTDARRDLAVGCSDEPFPRPFERAVDAPEPGDRLYIPVHQWLRKGAPRERQEVVVAEVVAGMIRLEAPPLPASSGACLLDTDGRLVAVYDGGFGPVTGSASGVWGEWGDVPPEWRDGETYGWFGAPQAAQGCAAEQGLKLRLPVVPRED